MDILCLSAPVFRSHTPTLQRVTVIHIPKKQKKIHFYEMKYNLLRLGRFMQRGEYCGCKSGHPSMFGQSMSLTRFPPWWTTFCTHSANFGRDFLAENHLVENYAGCFLTQIQTDLLSKTRSSRPATSIRC